MKCEVQLLGLPLKETQDKNEWVFCRCHSFWW